MPAKNIENYDLLKDVHPKVRYVVERASRYMPCRVLEGKRTVERQQKLIYAGQSKIKNASKAPHVLGHAVDLAPLTKHGQFDGWGNDPKELAMFYSLQAILRVVATDMGYKPRVGSDWDMDWSFKDQSFDDLVHFELIINP